MNVKKLFQDKVFIFGFAINILLFIILNILSFVISYNEFINRKIKFSHSGYDWGFPAEMYRNFTGYPYNEVGFTLDGVFINALFVVVSGFILGHLSKFVWSKISARKLM